MKLRRAWPAVGIWVIFLIFEFVMVASSGFFLGLFPDENKLIYSIVFAVLSILLMSVVVIFAGRCSDTLGADKWPTKVPFVVAYQIVLALILTGAVWYRFELLAHTSQEVTGKLSLYENAMVGGTPVAEYDLLSIIYSSILKVILLFTGNIITVPFFFQIACFLLFMICSFYTVKMLLGYGAALVFTAYVAFMPVFTPAFTGPQLSTDPLFMAMFGIEMLFVALFLECSSKKRYKSGAWIIWYMIVGVVVGFMSYMDAGTIIMIIPFLFAVLFIYGTKVKEEALRLLVVIAAAVLTFIGMFIQEQGIMMADVRFANWASYYFHNLNTFDMFWAYTDYKIIYLVTLVVMSGVIVGFWKNRTVEKISPWLWSIIFIFVSVPFMGATRMNTQTFVTVYYAFILACVVSLIALPADEEEAEYVEASAGESAEDETEEELKKLAEDAEEDLAKEPEEEIQQSSPEAEQGVAEVTEPDYEFEDEPETEPYAVPKAEAPEAEKPKADPEPKEEEHKGHFVPEGMVLPEDDEDVDLTPRMKIPEFTGTISLAETARQVNEKLKAQEKKEEINKAEDKKAEVRKPEERKNKAAAAPKTRKDDFDIDLKPGDDFDL
ncbi:hypothetical protein [Butyrivibrio sp. XPD2006]|uniref:hypothetical protein n=1 Tax=Butyrivibrio sp. XPD2006 TaxID=1280668 RepID=UPI0003B6BB6F|nr:hypothetical protein [Butyrivibrio sp. XPD2006]